MSGRLIIEGIQRAHNPILDAAQTINYNGYSMTIGGPKVYRAQSITGMGQNRIASHFMDVGMPDGTFTVDGDEHNFYEIRRTAAIQEDFTENHRGKHITQMGLLSEMHNVGDDVSRLLILLGNKDFACSDPSILNMFTNYTDYVRTMCEMPHVIANDKAVPQAHSKIPSAPKTSPLPALLRKVDWDSSRISILENAKAIAEQDVVQILHAFDWDSNRLDALGIIMKKINVAGISGSIIDTFDWDSYKVRASNIIDS